MPIADKIQIFWFSAFHYFEHKMVQVIKVKGHKANDVIATLGGQVLQTGYRVVIASPDKDFKQLLSEDVQLVVSLDELES
ncbi:hypothetical protein COP1_000720 [Malus domestica]